MLLLIWEQILKNSNADKIVKGLVWDYYKKRNLDSLIRKVYVNRRETPKTIYIEARVTKKEENMAQLIGRRGIHPNRIHKLFFSKWEVKII